MKKKSSRRARKLRPEATPQLEKRRAKGEASAAGCRSPSQVRRLLAFQPHDFDLPLAQWREAKRGSGYMYLVFLGESGNTGNSTNDPNQPHHIHVGLLVHESQSVSINGEYNALYRRHFGRPPGEPGTPTGLRPADIYQGMGIFSSWPVAKRYELIQDCLDILIRRHVPAIISYINKREYAEAKANEADPNSVWESPSEPVISRFLMALTMYLDEMSLRGLDEQQIMSLNQPIKDFALVVAGDGRSVEPRFMDQFLKSEDGQDATGLLENLYFVGTEYSVGTQLANMCAYFTRRWLQNPSASHPYFDALREHEVVQVIYPVQL